VFAYNHSDTYVAQVLALASAYRTGTPVSGIPVGDINGSLPPVKHVASPPPVDPAPPTAAQPVVTKPTTPATPGTSTSPGTTPSTKPTGGKTTTGSTHAPG